MLNQKDNTRTPFLLSANMAVLVGLLTAPGCTSVVHVGPEGHQEHHCDDANEQQGSNCLKVCTIGQDDPGMACSIEGQRCHYADGLCTYQGVCENGVWTGETECSDCDPTTEDAADACETECIPGVDDPGMLCAHPGQRCTYADAGCTYEGICQEDLTWTGHVECNEEQQ